MKIRQSALVLLVGLAGCCSGNAPNAAGVSQSSSASGYSASSASQRVVYSTDVSDNNFDEQVRRIKKPQKLTCVESNADAAGSMQAALDAALRNKGNGEVNAAYADSLLQVGKHLATVQLLRDELTDLCRTYANGAISGTTYQMRLNRLDKKMVALLSGGAAAEAMTGAGRAFAGSASQYQAGSAAGFGGAQGRVQMAAQSVEAAAYALASNSDASKQSSLQASLKGAMATLSEANREFAASSSASQSWSSSGQVQSGAANFSASTDVIGGIQENFQRADDASTIIDLCMANLADTAQGAGNTFSEYCRNVALPKMYSLMEKQAEARKEVALKQYEAASSFSARGADMQQGEAQRASVGRVKTKAKVKKASLSCNGK